MFTDSPRVFLRRALFLDAVASGASGLLLLLGAGLLAGPLGLPENFMRLIGLSFVPFVAFVTWTGTREQPSAGAVQSVIAMNAVWVVASIVFLFSGWMNPTLLGNIFVVVQAVAVAVFAQLQFVGLRRTSALPAGA